MSVGEDSTVVALETLVNHGFANDPEDLGLVDFLTPHIIECKRLVISRPCRLKENVLVLLDVCDAPSVLLHDIGLREQAFWRCEGETRLQIRLVHVC